MLSYKLAKQLKDAGFPQKLMAGDSYYSLVGHPRLGIPHQEAVCRIFIDMPDTASLLDDLVKIPTLEELIEWCGDGFGELGHWKGGNEAGDWQVISGIGHGMHNVWGKTPSKSMALLGLKLHK